MKIYVDKDNKCHAAAADGLREYDVSFFDDKCEEFIEGYRYVPESETITPWKPYTALDAAQREYEREQLADALNALSVLGVKPNG